MFSLLFCEHMGFLTRSIIIYDIYAAWDSAHSLSSYLLTGNLNFRFFFALSHKCETSKQKSYPTPSTLTWNPDLQSATCNLQPLTCNLQPALYTIRFHVSLTCKPHSHLFLKMELHACHSVSAMRARPIPLVAQLTAFIAGYCFTYMFNCSCRCYKCFSFVSFSFSMLISFTFFLFKRHANFFISSSTGTKDYYLILCNCSPFHFNMPSKSYKT